MKCLIGLDIGTRNCKAYAIDINGKIIAKVSRAYDLIFPSPGMVEQDPEDWWRASFECIKEIINRTKAEVLAIGLSSQANTLLLLDKEGKALMNAISWLDQRSTKEVIDLNMKFGEDEIHNITGMIPNPGFVASKILWFKKKREQLLRKTRIILFSPQSYIAYKLTGKFVVDRSLASFSMLYNIRRENWFNELLEFTGINEKLLPEILNSHEVVGEIKNEIKKKLGLKRDVMLIIGAHDQCCAALGAGLLDKSTIVDSTGTASAIIGFLDELPNKIPRNLLCYHYVIPRKWTILGTLSASGALIDWFLRLLGKRDIYRKMEEKARNVKAGSNDVIVLPYFSGSFRSEIPQQIKGAILGLTLSHEAHHIYRAIMEAISFEIKYFLEIIEEISHPINRVISVGGGSKSRLWREIKANVFGKPILRPLIAVSYTHLTLPTTERV